GTSHYVVLKMTEKQQCFFQSASSHIISQLKKPNKERKPPSNQIHLVSMESAVHGERQQIKEKILTCPDSKAIAEDPTTCHVHIHVAFVLVSIPVFLIARKTVMFHALLARNRSVCQRI
ncbi:hypothetical protein ACJX0J_034211, partial [Zea mays]